MKNCIYSLRFILMLTVILVLPGNVKESFADYKDIGDKVETIFEVWAGGYLAETDTSKNTSLAEEHSLPEAAGRVGATKAWEFYSPDSSPSGGFLYKDAPLPNRLHLEFDFYNDNDWYGDLRHSYKDYWQIRILPRRFYHNLDNQTLFDFSPAQAATTEVEINDQGIDDYGLRIDIDTYRIRLKMPDFPWHVYSDGEIVKRKGKRQSRFLGGFAYFLDPAGDNGRVRVSEAQDVDQRKQEFSFGTNAHLGVIEIDASHTIRKFDSDIAEPTYAYDIDLIGGTQTSVHNVIPETEATTNTVKIHSSHTGRIFGTATYSELEKTNEDSKAEAENTLGYGALHWLPVPYFSLTAKYRYRKNEAFAPSTVNAFVAVTDGNFPPSFIPGFNLFQVQPGVESQTDTGIISMRYSLIPKTNLLLQYTHKIKDVEEQSAIDWSRPQKTRTDTYEAKATCWAIPKVRFTARLKHSSIGTEFGTHDVVNNDPERTDSGDLAITWVITPKIMAFVNAYAAMEETDENRLSGGITDANVAEALQEQYLASITYNVNEKFSVTPSYTYMSRKQDRDMVWEDGAGAHVVDHGYSNQELAHNVALNMMFIPVENLNMNAVIDYTLTDGSYDPTTPYSLGLADDPIDTWEIARFSNSKTRELNLRLDSDYDFGHGWGVGVALRYTEWEDESVDNPADGTFIGGLLKLSKRL